MYYPCAAAAAAATAANVAVVILYNCPPLLLGLQLLLLGLQLLLLLLPLLLPPPTLQRQQVPSGPVTKTQAFIIHNSYILLFNRVDRISYICDFSKV